MAFDSLTEKLQNVFKNLRSKGRLTEEDVKAALKEVKMALLEADVNFKVVKNFVKTIQERAVGQDVLNSLTPGQMVVKLVNEELVTLMGSDTTEIALKPSSEISVILMPVKRQQQQRLQASLRRKAGDLYLQPVTYIVRQL